MQERIRQDHWPSCVAIWANCAICRTVPSSTGLIAPNATVSSTDDMYYYPNGMNPGDRQKFVVWYNNLVNQNCVFDFHARGMQVGNQVYRSIHHYNLFSWDKEIQVIAYCGCLMQIWYNLSIAVCRIIRELTFERLIVFLIYSINIRKL